VDAIVTQFKGATRQKPLSSLLVSESLEALGIITQNPEETTIPAGISPNFKES
jgi:hypothetical protein